MARAGKDSFAFHLSEIIRNEFNVECQILSFADCLKRRIDQFVLENTGISALTQDTTEKQIIRPLLVAYGMTMRMLNPDHWILQLEPTIKTNQRTGVVSIITDVRFPNEVDYLKEFNNSAVLHLSRISPDGSVLPPANTEEAENDPICRKKSDYNFVWNTFKDNSEEYKDYIRGNFLSLLK